MVACVCRSLGLLRATDLADDDDKAGVRVLLEGLQVVGEGTAVDRIAADPDAGADADAELLTRASPSSANSATPSRIKAAQALRPPMAPPTATPDSLLEASVSVGCIAPIANWPIAN